MITGKQLRDRLQRACDAAGSQKAWAAANGVSAAYVNDCLQGRREIGEGISVALGYRPVTLYVSTKINAGVMRKGVDKYAD